MKFSALNVDFDGPSLGYLSSRTPAHEGIKKRYPCKSHYFPVVGQSFMKTVADRLPITTSTIVTSFSVVSTSMTLKDPELPK